MADPKNKKNENKQQTNVKPTVKTSKYGFTYTSREDREQKLVNLHRLQHGKGQGQPSIHYGDDNNKWKKQGLSNTSSPTNMKKQYKVKDINNNGKIDGWEQGKYDAINNSATKMGYSMKMGSKENYSPTNFRTKDAMLMGQSPMYKLKDSYAGGDPNSFENNMSKYLKPEPKIDQSASINLDNVDVGAKSLTPSEKLAAGKKRKADGKAVIKNARKEIRSERKDKRKETRVGRLENRRDLQKAKGDIKAKKGDQIGATYKKQRIDRINKRIAKNK